MALTLLAENDEDEEELNTAENSSLNSPEISFGSYDDSEYLPDPIPIARKSKTRQPRARVESTATAATIRRVSGDIAGVVEMIAALWEFTGDHCCAPVLEEQATALGKAIAGILKRYPRLLAKMDESDLISVVLQAGVAVAAIKPVVAAVYRNHVIAEKEVDDGRNLDIFEPYRPGPAYDTGL
jgi:hypothetical protein